MCREECYKTLCNAGHVETRRAAKQTDTTQCVTFCVLFDLKGAFLAERSDLANASGIPTCHGTLIFSHMHTHTGLSLPCLTAVCVCVLMSFVCL